MRTTGRAPQIRPVDRGGPMPLSCSQERLWFLLHLHRGMRAYQFQATIELSGTLDTDALARALTEVVRRHEIYRTTFTDGPDGPRQVVHPPFPVELPVDDLCDAPDPEAAAREAIRQAVNVDVPFRQLPLVSWRLLRTAPERHILLHLEHHLIHDGWAFNVFVDELCALYTAYAVGKPSPLPEPGLQFADFAAWQRQWLDGPEAQRQLAYWTRQLDGVPHYLDLPTDRPRTRARRFTGDAPRFTVPACLADQARELARRERVSLFTVMLAAFEVMLHGWSGKDDFCVGTGMAARSRPETERLLGMLVNTVALRADLRGDPSFRDLLGRARMSILGALQSQDIPFDRVVAALRPQRLPGRQPLCEVMFAFHDSPLGPVRMPGLEVGVTVGVTNGSAKFDLGVIAIPRVEQAIGRGGGEESGDIEFIWEYDRDLFDAETIARVAGQYERMLAAVTENPLARVSALAQEREPR
ncbi:MULTISPECIES: condensation domain-containing protein [unclassified Streptomyces]|uniref:condensation domain-containing protein n=1 Tax=unclassified Streptomyces TaxID=2593676 RepID=UPI002365CE37|nr:MULTISPECIES: condensation domain-containing protein [unclassified Streptomyces]MDF3142964.1 condensation domain-containing protein [Streptomyces sp. T21Q-yed]WDF42883.1 condensation domain-containing protein [Streptomyces sp. T12]